MTQDETVHAAGALVWRRHQGELQLLLVHSHRHGHWGWPKGKVEAGEALHETAVREVEEETGVRVRLGARLPGTSYVMPDGRPKTVAYWAAQALGGEAGVTLPDEIDDVLWLTPEQILERVPRETDRSTLEELLRRDAEGTLDTWPLLVLRHASARRREKWDGAEAARPLTGKGRRGARRLADLLRPWHVDLAITSPWERCRATVAPFAEAAGVPLVEDPRLTEEGVLLSTDGARTWLREMLDAARPVVVCTHRPDLPALFESVREHTEASVEGLIPRRNPLLKKGQFAVLHVRRHGSSTADVVGVELVTSE